MSTYQPATPQEQTADLPTLPLEPKQAAQVKGGIRTPTSFSTVHDIHMNEGTPY